jgi:hypothetical protein
MYCFITLYTVFCVYRTQLLLPLLTRIASRRTVTMFLLKTVGMHTPSYSSTALSAQRMEDSPRIQPTGNSTLMIPHKFSKRKDSGFPFGCADAAAADGRRGSNDVNPWLWQFGRDRPRLRGLTVQDTTERKKSCAR